MTLKQIYDTRRSVNFFDKEKPISDELLENIINMAVLAPSAFNLQPWEIIAVKSEEAKQKLHAVANKQPKILEAPVTLIIVGKRNAFDASNPVWQDKIEAAGGDPAKVKGSMDAAARLYGSSDEKKVKFAESNGGLIAMSIMYAAKSFEVDSHPMSGIDFAGIKEAFELGEGKEAVMLISLGYHDEKRPLHGRAKRRGFDQIVTVM
jgi:nitroreductase